MNRRTLVEKLTAIVSRRAGDAAGAIEVQEAILKELDEIHRAMMAQVEAARTDGKMKEESHVAKSV